MKTKIAKRPVSDYEDSLSSKGSCTDSIITQFQLSSCIISCSSHSMLAKQNLQTPYKSINRQQRNYTLQKLFSYTPKQFKQIGSRSQSKENSSLFFESEDSKLRKKQGHYIQSEETKYKKYARTLKFQDQSFKQQADKENEPLNINMDQFSACDDGEESTYLKRIRCSVEKRKVGKVLYLKQDPLWSICEEDNQNSCSIK